MTKHETPLESIQHYIDTGWDRLHRSLNRCESYTDPKTKERLPALYLPAEYPEPPEIAELPKDCGIRLERLPKIIHEHGELDASALLPHGLLYLEHPYVVPGGQFNEMYGWDSYFIILGLLRDHRLKVARGMVENFFFEIAHYGGALNANRTYYLSRSQPPFLTSMIFAIYDAEHAQGHVDRAWLQRGYKYAVKDYKEWAEAPHLAGDTGLSRYFAHGVGPVPEILGDPDNYYLGVAHYFLMHGDPTGRYLQRWNEKHPPERVIGPIFPISGCVSEHAATEDGAAHNHGPECDAGDRMALTEDYYEGDRSMRESGFDVSFRFDPYSAGTHHYAPVCLNSLLYRTEKDLERMSRILGHQEQAHQWAAHAAERKRKIDRYLWNEKAGQYFDWNIDAQTQSAYEFASTFYPLWAGAASEAQARAVAANLKLFEEPGGIVTSRTETQAQWDYPYGWAPLQLLAIEGLRRYGYAVDADRLSYKFLSMVLENYEKDGTIREKYDLLRRTAETKIRAGYRTNFVGFGWTNGVFLELLHALPAAERQRLNEEAQRRRAIAERGAAPPHPAAVLPGQIQAR